jgi:glycosyltransferase involved in cell wall biosynthesis
VAKRCSKGSLAGSLLAAAEMTLHHRVLDIYGSVDTFISPSRFLMGKLVEMGFSKPLEYLPNFIDVQALESHPTGEDDAFVYFGRLTPEKGLRTLIAAMEGVPGSCHIIGDGPLRDELRGLVADKGLRNVFFTPHLPFPELVARVRRAAAVVLPSEWYENSPRSVLEAFALGKAVVGARSGGIPELVGDGVTGYTFAPGDVADLRRVLLSSLSDKARVAAMGAQARRLVEQAHGPDAYCDRLVFLCRRALERR